MQIIFTQSGPGLSIMQGGLGPVVQLGFGVTGEAASLGTAPSYAAVAPTDTVLLERAGALAKVPASVFEAFSAPSVTAETARATAAEGVLSTGLAETNTMVSAQLAAANLAITTEASRATSAEGSLSVGLAAAEVTLASHGVSLTSLGGAIAAETARAQAVEQSLQSQIGSSTVSTAQVIAALTSISTTLPATFGQLWNNNGVLSIS